MSPPPLGYFVRAWAVKSTDRCSSEKLKALNASPAPQVLSKAVNTPCFLAFLTRFLRSGNSKVTEPAASNHNSLLFQSVENLKRQ